MPQTLPGTEAQKTTVIDRFVTTNRLTKIGIH